MKRHGHTDIVMFNLLKTTTNMNTIRTYRSFAGFNSQKNINGSDQYSYFRFHLEG